VNPLFLPTLLGELFSSPNYIPYYILLDLPPTFIMIGASFWSKSLLGKGSSDHSPPGVVGRQLTPVLNSFSRRACVHPIYTIVSVAILASTTYLGLLESSLFDRRISVNNAIGRVDFNTLLVGSKRLYTGKDTNWKWSVEETRIHSAADDVRCPPELSVFLDC
jgi:hydroxymethylglutaryl-CoA reductase (NADPH)